MSDSLEIVFRASFPPIQSAIKRSGAGDGMRIQLDIPECDVADAIALQALVMERLLVKVSVLRDEESGNDDGEQHRNGRKLHI